VSKSRHHVGGCRLAQRHGRQLHWLALCSWQLLLLLLLVPMCVLQQLLRGKQLTC
jgi:hypothetical protein